MSESTTAWRSGLSTFAGIMMMVLGGWWIIAGLVALFNSEFYVVTREYIFQFDVTTWGWIHLLLGIVILLAGFYLFTGAVWARTVGVIVAVLWALVAFAWMPWYPIWAIAFLAVSIFVIWALTAHGRDIVEA